MDIIITANPQIVVLLLIGYLLIGIVAEAVFFQQIEGSNESVKIGRIIMWPVGVWGIVYYTLFSTYEIEEDDSGE